MYIQIKLQTNDLRSRSKNKWRSAVKKILSEKQFLFFFQNRRNKCYFPWLLPSAGSSAFCLSEIKSSGASPVSCQNRTCIFRFCPLIYDIFIFSRNFPAALLKIFFRFHTRLYCTLNSGSRGRNTTLLSSSGAIKSLDATK